MCKGVPSQLRNDEITAFETELFRKPIFIILSIKYHANTQFLAVGEQGSSSVDPDLNDLWVIQVIKFQLMNASFDRSFI